MLRNLFISKLIIIRINQAVKTSETLNIAASYIIIVVVSSCIVQTLVKPVTLQASVRLRETE